MALLFVLISSSGLVLAGGAWAVGLGSGSQALGALCLFGAAVVNLLVEALEG